MERSLTCLLAGMIFLAGQLEGAKRYDEALAVVTEATGKAPENAAAWFSLGVVQDKLGKLDQVIAAQPGEVIPVAQLVVHLVLVRQALDSGARSVRSRGS